MNSDVRILLAGFAMTVPIAWHHNIYIYANDVFFDEAFLPPGLQKWFVVTIAIPLDEWYHPEADMKVSRSLNMTILRSTTTANSSGPFVKMTTTCDGAITSIARP